MQIKFLFLLQASAIEQMKYEISRELGVTLGPDTSSRANGSVGGEITKRLVRMAEEQLTGQYRLH
ncbi:acid-soluble spore protein [Bacillus cereus]|uniref:Alpha/beta-type small acid-soluble spore protein n=1 Tax=Bacillus tropicus TaxID=2026188 RepID=A0A7T2QL15_9BACI|nr:MULTISPECIES: alpha/beta-type small acid-soluble spore protein [Bacillus cereus group]OPA23987.1 spore protein [Bacillus cereus]PEC87404.1 acid-soluble spore protein [Bacillus cereus]PEX40040.1 acid-soluble spore protein [Bacillus cereus]PFB16531.1 acid-soluble spore protein [Bacillus cereus]PFP60605.1 acid-soluble spore protein [Bacillus cereus]